MGGGMAIPSANHNSKVSSPPTTSKSECSLHLRKRKPPKRENKRKKKSKCLSLTPLRALTG